MNEETSIAFSACVDCYQYTSKLKETKTKCVELRFLLLHQVYPEMLCYTSLKFHWD